MERELVEKIDAALKQFDLILLLIDGVGAAENLTVDFCCSEALMQTPRKVLILSQMERFHQKHWNGEYRQISNKEQQELCSLYWMYEFSDHFQVLADCPQFGGMLNYVKTGMLTKEEIFWSVLK